eukprot:752115-Hanusia_phi.AAC.3
MAGKGSTCSMVESILRSKVCHLLPACPHPDGVVGLQDWVVHIAPSHRREGESPDQRGPTLPRQVLSVNCSHAGLQRMKFCGCVRYFWEVHHALKMFSDDEQNDSQMPGYFRCMREEGGGGGG